MFSKSVLRLFADSFMLKTFEKREVSSAKILYIDVNPNKAGLFEGSFSWEEGGGGEEG